MWYKSNTQLTRSCVIEEHAIVGLNLYNAVVDKLHTPKRITWSKYTTRVNSNARHTNFNRFYYGNTQTDMQKMIIWLHEIPFVIFMRNIAINKIRYS